MKLTAAPRILCTFPGRAGDLLWALPTVRAISEQANAPVDLCIAHEFAGMVPLLAQQPYLAGVWAQVGWGLTPPEEWRAPLDSATYQRYTHVYDLGYRGWPAQDLARETWTRAQTYGLTLPPLDLSRPWITVDSPGPSTDVVCGFTEAWFELKVGLLHLLCEAAWEPDMDYQQLVPPHGRWDLEVGDLLPVVPCDWLTAANIIAASTLVLSDCSALHVLAVALGKPVVVMEPMEARWNDIFYPLGTHDRVRLVRGHDGLPTFDARAVVEAVRGMRAEAEGRS